jgi:hypothetical protein
MSAFLELSGHAATAAFIRVPNIGAWIADVSFAEAFLPTGKVTLNVGPAAFVGTVDPDLSGSFGLRSRVRIVAGAGAWGLTAPRRAWHNDAGVKLSHVLNDTASSVGEALGPLDDVQIGIDFVRREAPARRVLARLAPGWWVDYAGVTQTRPRPTSDATSYTVLDFDTAQNVTTLEADDVRTVTPGMVIRKRLDEPLTVRELSIAVTSSSARLVAWGTT